MTSPSSKMAKKPAKKRTGPTAEREAPLPLEVLVLERLNRMAELLTVAGWEPEVEALDFYRGSLVLAWLGGAPVDALDLEPSDLVDFGYSWGYLEGQAHAANLTALEYLDSLYILPILRLEGTEGPAFKRLG